MAQQIQLRGGTAAVWTLNNPVLAEREMGVETDTQSYKIGDGVTPWNLLPYKGLQPVLGVTTLEAPAAEPSTPTAGLMRLYSKAIAGKLIPKFKGPTGLASPVQSALWSNNAHFISPGATTLPNVIGGPALTAVGTISHPALAATSLVTQMRRFINTSAAVAPSIAENRVAATQIWRGNAAARGGFFHRTCFAIESTTALQRGFIGFTAVATATATTQDPAALLNAFGIGWGSADTNLRIYTANAALGMSVDLGVEFPANNVNNIYEITFFAPPFGDVINYQVVNITTGSRITGVLTTNLPPAATFLAYHAWINNGGTAAAVVLGTRSIYTETDI